MPMASAVLGAGLAQAERAERGPRPHRTRLLYELRPGPHGLPCLALELLPLDRLALVVRPLAAGAADLDLHPALLQVGAQGDEREPPLRDLPRELVDLAPVQEELPVPVLGVIHQVAVAVGADPAAHEEELVAAAVDVGVAEVEAAL